MPAPDQVNSRRFPVSSEDVLYNDEGISIAFSKWDRDTPAVGMCWNYEQGGASETGKGFPNQGLYSTWFILSKQTAIAMLIGLLQTEFEGKNESKLRKALLSLGGSIPK
jgi:hypothetical protein